MVDAPGASVVRVTRTPGETWVSHCHPDGTLLDLLLQLDGEPRLYGSVHMARLKRLGGKRGVATATLHTGLEVWVDQPPSHCSITGRPATDGALVALRMIEEARADKLARASGRIEVRGRRLILIAGEKGTRLTHRIADPRQRAEIAKGLAQLPTDHGAWLATRWAVDNDPELLALEAEALATRLGGMKVKAAMSGAAVELAPPTSILEECFFERVPDGELEVICNKADLMAATDDALSSLSGRQSTAVRLDLALRPPWMDTELGEQTEAALGTEVPFQDGRLYIEPTQALTAIDVDADPAIGFAAANKGAAATIVRQLRLRDLGGIVVIDPAGSGVGQNAKTMARALEAAASLDPYTNKISAAGNGLTSLVRERRRPSLPKRLSAQISARDAFLPSVHTAANRALAECVASAKIGSGGTLVLELATNVAQYLNETEVGQASLSEAIEATGQRIQIIGRVDIGVGDATMRTER